MGKMLLTTTPSTKLTKINDLTDVSEEHVFSSGMITLKVNRFEKIGNDNAFLSCNKCRKRFKIWIWEKELFHVSTVNQQNKLKI